MSIPQSKLTSCWKWVTVVVPVLAARAGAAEPVDQGCDQRGEGLASFVHGRSPFDRHAQRARQLWVAFFRVTAGRTSVRCFDRKWLRVFSIDRLSVVGRRGRSNAAIEPVRGSGRGNRRGNARGNRRHRRMGEARPPNERPPNFCRVSTARRCAFPCLRNWNVITDDRLRKGHTRTDNDRARDAFSKISEVGGGIPPK